MTKGKADNENKRGKVITDEDLCNAIKKYDSIFQ